MSSEGILPALRPMSRPCNGVLGFLVWQLLVLLLGHPFYYISLSVTIIEMKSVC